MTVSNEDKKMFFTKLSKLWTNFKDYSYISGITLSHDQISIIEQNEKQMLIEGYAGTGKSLTLLYKFIDIIVRENNKRILFVTYNSALIDDTKKRLNLSKEYIDNVNRHETFVMTFHEISSKILKTIRIINKECNYLTADRIKKFEDDEYRRIASISARYIQKTGEMYKMISDDEKLYSTHNEKFIMDEIRWIKAMGFTKLENYLATERTGRSKSIRLTRNQRKTIFRIYKEYQKEMESSKYGYATLDLEDYALKILENSTLIEDDLKFDYVFVDEVQDLDPMQVMALCKLTKGNIILSGDAKQRIYKKCPIKYEQLGLNVNQKGRRKLLKKNFRSTKEIVNLANSLRFYDSDGKYNTEDYEKHGDKPIIKYSNDINKILKYVVNEIKTIQHENPKATIAIVNREEIKNRTGNKSNFRIGLEMQLMQSLVDVNTYNKKFDFSKEKQIFYTNVYDIKGLEFDVVFVMDFNKIYYPYSEGIQKIKDNNDSKDESSLNDDLIEFYNTEKKLLYVAMTRAKERLYLIASGNFNNSILDPSKKISEYIFDFETKDYISNGFKKTDIESGKSKYNNVGFGRILKDKQEYKIQMDIDKSMLKEGLKSQTKIEKNEIKDAVTNEDYPIANQDNLTRDEIIEKIIKPVLGKNKIRFIDNRSKKGAFWVIGGMEIADILKVFSKYKVSFIFKKDGGRAVWYTK